MATATIDTASSSSSTLILETEFSVKAATPVSWVIARENRSFFPANIDTANTNLKPRTLGSQLIVDIDSVKVDNRMYRSDIPGKSPARTQEYGANQIEIL